MSVPQDAPGGRSRTVDVDGPLHLVDYGGSGPPLVLLHGLGGSHLNWMLVALPLSRSFRVIAVDLPGFGLTPPEGRSTDVRRQAQLLRRFIEDEVGEPAYLAGNSMGGLVALLAAERAPELVRGIVLIDPALPPTSLEIPSADTVRFLGLPLLPGIGAGLLARRRERRSVADHVAATLDYVTVDASRLPDEVRTAGEAMEAARRRMPWSIRAFVDAGRSIALVLARRRSYLNTVHGIGAPVLLIHGKEDAIVPVESARWLADERPDWEFHVLAGIGHVPQLEAPAAVIELITAWQRRHAAAASSGV